MKKSILAFAFTTVTMISFGQAGTKAVAVDNTGESYEVFMMQPNTPNMNNVSMMADGTLKTIGGETIGIIIATNVMGGMQNRVENGKIVSVFLQYDDDTYEMN